MKLKAFFLKRGSGGDQKDFLTKKSCRMNDNSLILLVPRDRIELPTRGFSVRCSTD